ncbi:MAG: GTP-binding protein, partial [Candidatus Omnitrophica bacterium]|nr:GTP-binding protein [Candidatus Omnitrophota bacterium]
AAIDFLDEEISPPHLEAIAQKIKHIDGMLLNILNNAKRGRIFREGVHVVICGKPNVGKSSLLNALLRQERSIVTPVAGTTRDTIEEIIDIKGIPVRVVDTAGILEPRDLVEKKAVQRSKSNINQADLVLVLFDASKKLSREDRFLISKLKKKTNIAVVNKIDLKQKIERHKLAQAFKHIIAISAKKLRNIELLEEKIADLVYGGLIASPEPAIVSNLRHIRAVDQAEKILAEASKTLDNKLSLELVAQDIKEAVGFLDDLLGKKFSEDLLDKIFSEFCIGK